MSTLGEFSSLLQLGVGFGIGLSLFRAPMTLLVERLDRELKQEMDVVSTIESRAAQRLRADIASLKMDVASRTDTLNSLNLPFMIAAILGAVVNWLALILASIAAPRPLSSTEEWCLIFISVGWFILIGLAVAVAALVLLLPSSRKLSELRRR